ncbi:MULTISPECIES: 30S ribosome-binding factor RbfA [Maritimibacter]|jgi:ribosome-binding factor A|uniref:Ribosome-binding factor A n=1 Tax=Maritimibacter alkaliphilus HTCC2654 TaxID=314271 RepID=A3VCC9_9RHOB|nr:MULTISPECIES: 30S ribosome-binding factor RbfA [Maritimibacter]EAQ13793.1 ribosome-binding factor A [Maritimibacter alkaliphilus HTCC2654]TYP83990.1 ribosome-binding factor A [Maritimibacter alkaliphilus HTCC2654]
MSKNRFNEGTGPSQRQLRVGELIRRTLSDVLMRGEIHDPDLNRMSITVGEVRTSPDLKIATAYVLPLGGKNPDEAIKALARNKHELRRFIGKVTNLKFTPDLRFMIDETFDQMDATRRLFSDETVQRDIHAGDEEE